MSRRSFAVVFLTGLLLAPGTPATAEDTAAVDLATLKAAGVETTPAGLLAFFKKRTLSDEMRQRILSLIRQLGADEFVLREKATQDLIDLGTPGRPLLTRALEDRDLEIRKRARTVLARLQTLADDAVLLPAAARALAKARPAGAAEVLLAFLPNVEDADLTDEVARSLAPLTPGQGGTLSPAVVAALADPLPLKRAAAAGALAAVGGAAQRPAVRKLLTDPDSGVRRRVALALLEARDRAALPALIALLTAPSADDASVAENALLAVAGERAPASREQDTPAAREQQRRVWQQWWDRHGPTIDLAKVDLDAVGKGFTLVATMSTVKTTTGSVMELDSAGKVRWRIDNLSYPVYASRYRRDRVLICEYYGNRVSERDLKGTIVWQKVLPAQVLSAERLPDGRYFAVTRNGLLELDRLGNVTRTITRPYDVLAAHRQRDGKITLLTTSGNCLRLDSEGKQLGSFAIGFLGSPIGFRAHFLPSGGVVVPDYSRSKVREFDAAGKTVWEADAMRPNAVVRLANGNTLVASRLRNRIFELDRSGKEVNGWNTEGRPLFVDRR